MSEKIQNRITNEKRANDIVKNLSILSLDDYGKNIRNKILINLYLEENYIELLKKFGDEKNELIELENLLNINITKLKTQLIKEKFYELVTNNIGENAIVSIIKDFALRLGVIEDELLEKLNENPESIITLTKNRVKLKDNYISIDIPKKKGSKKSILIFLVILLTIINIGFYLRSFTIFKKNENTINEYNLRKSIQSKENLNESLLDFKRPILQFHTLKNTIRIDELNNGKYRYSSFTDPKTTKDSPDTIIQTGYFDEKTSSFKFNVTFLGIIYSIKISDGKPIQVNVYDDEILVSKFNVKKIHYSNINKN